MICPNCGRGNVAEKKYCPSCGLKLEAIAQALAQEQAQLQGHDNALKFSDPKERRGPSVFAVGFFAVIFGLLLAFVGGAILANNIVANTGVITMILGMAGVGYGAITKIERGMWRSSPAKTRLSETQTNPLPITLQPTSITEQTTRNLEMSLEDGERRRPSNDLSLP